MGRRAADVTTPVPVLGVPALVGVRAWKTTGGDRTGGALLHTWGLHSSVGVQTSPGISRPPAQLSDTPSTLSDNITQASSSYISKETEYSQILLLTKADKEKRAILKPKSGESKSKKEVTFKALGREAPGDVACSQRSISGTFCYARAIRTNPHVAGSGKNARPKLKSAARYTNGSVVDSEAIGGISVDDGQAEPVKTSTFRGRDQTRQQGHYAEQPVKTLLLPAAQPILMPQKICSHCGGRQTVIGAATFGETGPGADACPLKLCHTDRNRTLEPSQHQIPEGIGNAVNPQASHLNDEASFRKHPACPVHSRGHVVTLSHARAAGDAPPPQPSFILQAQSVTVTKATIETSEALADLKSFAKAPPGSKTPRPTSLTLTPQAATAAKPDEPHSHTYPRPLKTSSQHNVPQNVCVSVHAPPENTLPPPYSHRNTSNVNTATAFDSLGGYRWLPMTSPTESPRTSSKCPTSHKESELTRVWKTTTKASPAAPSSAPAHKPQVKLTSQVMVHSNALVKIPQHTSTPQLSFAPHGTLTLNAPSPQTTHASTTRDAESHAARIHPTQTLSSNSEPSLHVTTAAVVTTPTSAPSPASRAKLPSSPFVSSASRRYGAVYNTTALKNSSMSLKNTPATVSSSPATLTENQTNVCVSRTALLQSADTRQHELSRDARDITSQTSDESGVCNEAINSKRARLALSQDVSKLRSGHGEARTRELKSRMNPNTESDTAKSKCNGNLINELVVREPQDHGNSNLSQVTNLQNYICLIKSGSSCLRGCINTEQQRQAHYQGYTESEHEGHCGPCPPVKSAQETELKTEQLALGESARHANIKLKSNADKQTHPNYSSPSTVAQTNRINSAPAHANVHADPSTRASVHQNPQHTRAHTGPELCFTAPAPLRGQGALSAHAGPECNSAASHRPYGAEAIVRAHSKLLPAPPQPCPEDAGLAHAHPAGAALLLPPSPQSCKSAALQQRLETVEASLAANKARITTLLNIIHDLEMCHTPTSGRRGCKTGQDLKNCSTCQKTACIVYSVEYDFRQQERRFLEVLNQARGSDPFSLHLSQPLSFSLLRNLIKNLTKSKVKSKKLCKALFKWLPKKIQQV